MKKHCHVIVNPNNEEKNKIEEKKKNEKNVFVRCVRLAQET